MAKIYIKFNSAVIKEFELSKPEITFGRKSDNDIVIDHPTVSGHHGKLRLDGLQYFVDDLNSTNGTFVNGHRVKSAALKNKDQIGVASHIFEFITDNASPSLPDKPIPDSIRAAPQPTEEIKPVPVKETPAAPAPAIIKSDDAPTPPATGIIRVVAGGVNGQAEIKLKDLNTYIGTSDQAVIKIKGFMAPSLAAVVSRRPEGYFLKAVKPGYPKVNGNTIQEQVFLENGALIEVGGTNMVFYTHDKKPA